MLKKTLKFFRNLLIGAVWTYVLLACAAVLLFSVWNFNLFSLRDWKTISDFWNAGGIIKTSRDYLFLLSLLLLPLLWIWGWRKLIRVNYLNLLLFPLNAYNRHIINKYGHDSPRIVLRNLKSSQKAIEEIKEKIEAIKPEAPKQVGSIREEILKKLESTQK